MQEQMRILIGYDGSPSADAALDDLRRAGLPRNAEVVILTVSEVWLPPPSNHDAVSSRPSAGNTAKSQAGQAAAAVAPVSEAQSLLGGAKARLQTRFPSWVIKVEESAGSPSREILKRADEFKPHLIVVGCQGHSAVGRFLLGSVSQKVVNEARCTVRVSRGTAWKDGSPVRIVIGLDGTPGSELAVKAVAGRVWPTSSSVRLVSVVDQTDLGIGEHIVSSFRKKGSSSNKAVKQDWIEKFMNDAAKALRLTLLSISTRVEVGDPKRVLIADAEEWGADCIFLGASTATNRLQKFLLGTVATAIIARAQCSVEVVRGGY
jgi:nucleotide-binding universal stress UspA family protein